MAETIIRVPGKFIADEYGTKLANLSDLNDDVNNRSYDSSSFSGMGKKNLEKHIVDNKNILQPADFSTANTIYVIQHDFELSGNITIPDNCVLEFDGGSISGMKITLSDNCSIVGGTINACLLEANGAKNIVIEDTVIDGKNTLSIETLADFKNCDYVTLRNLTFKDYKNNDWINHLIEFDHCNNIIFSDIIFDKIYPEGPLFSYCKNLVIDKITNIDDRVEGSIGTHLNIFYSEDVKIQNCYFKNERVDGSTINLCAKNATVANCTFIGGQGIDISNETSVDYASENVLIIGCTIKNTTGFGVYTYPTYGSVHDVVIDSCKINVWRAFDVRDSYNVKCINSSIVCSGQNGPGFLYNWKTAANKRNGNVSVENCEISCVDGRLLNIYGDFVWDGGYSFKNCRISISGNDNLIVWDATKVVPKIEFVDATITVDTLKDEIYPSFHDYDNGKIMVGNIKYENCVLTNLKFGQTDNRYFINNVFNDCIVQAYQNQVFKSNKMQVIQVSASKDVYRFEHSNSEDFLYFAKAIISENDFGGNNIYYNESNYAANMVFENNSNYEVYNGMSEPGFGGDKFKNTMLSRNTYSRDVGPSGIADNRPDNPPIGFCYLDTSLSTPRPIWYDGNQTTGWIDADGLQV